MRTPSPKEEEEDSQERANGNSSETREMTPGGTRDSQKTEGKVRGRASAREQKAGGQRKQNTV